VSTIPLSVTQLRPIRHKKKLKTKNVKSTNLEKLSEFLTENNISEAEAIERLQVQLFDPAKDFYAVLITASKELMKSVRDHTLNLEDPYQDGLFKLLQAGDKVNKSLKLAKLEAYPEEEAIDDGDSFLDRMNKKR
jgi:hypothetical protein